MLFEALDLVQPQTDLLVLDRGYPSNALAAALTQTQRHFCWRVDATDWACVRQFLRSGQTDALVSLAPPSAADTATYTLRARPPAMPLAQRTSGDAQRF